MQAVIVATLLALSAAHVTFNPDYVEPGTKYFFAEFRVSHGCSGNNTISLHLEVPTEYVTGMKASPTHLFSSIERVMDEETLAVTDIYWDNGTLHDEQVGIFGVQIVFNESMLAEGDAVYFPIHQICENESDRPWVEIPDEPTHEAWHMLESPAPVIYVKNVPVCQCADEDDAHKH